MIEGTLHPLHAARLRRGLSQEALAAATGLGVRTIKRAEAGGRLRPHTTRLLAAYLKRSPEALGLLPYGRVQGEPRDDQHAADGDGEYVRRRELLGLLSVAGSAATWSSEALPGVGVDWLRLAGAISDPGRLDDTVLQDCAALNRSLWQAFHAATRTHVLLAPALAQLRQLTGLAGTMQMAAHSRRLYALVAEVGQLVGLLYYHANQDAAAVRCYTASAGAAKAAGDYDLWATALVRHAFIPLFDGHPEHALPLLEDAARLAQRGDSTLGTRYWVAAVSADPYAAVGDLTACERALGLAEGVGRLRAGAASNGTWLRCGEADVLENRGASLLTAGLPEQAEPAFRGALTSWPTPSRRRGLLLADLARTALRTRDAERACDYGRQAVAVARQCSGMFVRSLRALDTDLDAYTDVPAVRELKERIRLAA
jgi:transcriptional regulator with XRE-family HTH domain